MTGVGRFERDEGGQVVFANYRRAERRLIIDHVEAPVTLRGTGAAGRLMQDIAAYARGEGLRILLPSAVTRPAGSRPGGSTPRPRRTLRRLSPGDRRPWLSGQTGRRGVLGSGSSRGAARRQPCPRTSRHSLLVAGPRTPRGTARCRCSGSMPRSPPRQEFDGGGGEAAGQEAQARMRWRTRPPKTGARRRPARWRSYSRRSRW